METSVLVGFDDCSIFIEKKGFYFSFTREHLKNIPPEIDVNSIVEVVWNVNDQTYLTLNDGSTVFFAEDKYNDYVQPYVDLWYAEKDRIDKEQEEQKNEWAKFENAKPRKLNLLNEEFDAATNRAYVVSSLGFTIDANETANRNVTGLISTIGDSTVQFCDYYNQFHELNKAQLETLLDEITKNGQNLYAQKWAIREAINATQDNEGLEAVEIEFTYMDFSGDKE